MKKTLIGILILLLVTALLVSVGFRLGKQVALTGKYTALFEDNKHFLELKADNTYTHRILDKTGREYTNVGTWKFRHLDGGPIIEVTDFSYIRFGKLESSGLRIVPVKRSIFGRTKLWFSEWLIFSYSGHGNQMN